MSTIILPSPAAVAARAALERRMRYNTETTARFAELKSQLSIAIRLEKRSEWQAAEVALEVLIREAHKLRIHLNAWEQYKPPAPT